MSKPFPNVVRLHPKSFIMKHNYLLLSSLLLASFAVLFSSNSGGPASNGNKATGAPGDGATTCVTCHSGGSFGAVSIDLTVEDGSGNAITEYTPGETYAVSVQVTNASGTPSGYGFQAIALEDGANTTLNSFSNAGTGVQLSTTDSRQYAEHTGAKADGAFSFDWTAPSLGTGSVTFYVGANAVNGNGNNGNDNAGLGDFTIAEIADTTDTNGGDPNGIAELGQFKVLSVYPNPAVDQVQVLGLSSNDLLRIYDVQGKLVQTKAVRNGSLDLADLESGVYILRSEKAFGRFIKI